jgi:hypothetical protein
VTWDRCYDLKKIFSPKNVVKKWRFYSNYSYLVYCKIDYNIGFERNANCFAENWQKSQKIVIITWTPDWAKFCHFWEPISQ